MSFEYRETSDSIEKRLLRAKEELEHNPKDLIALVDKCVIGICITDDKGVFIHANDAYCQIYGYTHEQLIGKPFTIMAPSEDRHEVWQAIYDAFIEDGQEMAGEWVVMSKAGKLLTIFTDAVRIGTAASGYQKCTFVNDITDFRIAERDLAELRSRFAAVVQQPFLALAIVDVKSQEVLLANKAFMEQTGASPDTERVSRVGDLLSLDEGDWAASLAACDEEAGTLVNLHWTNSQSGVQGHLRRIGGDGTNEVLVALKG